MMSTTPLGLVSVLALSAGLSACGGGNAAPSPVPDPQPPPTVGAIAPASGIAWRRTSVEVHGTGFRTGVRVLFGQESAYGTRLLDSGTIRAATPLNNSVGSVDVTVINADGGRAVLSRSFTFESQPLPTLTASAAVVDPGSALSVTWNTASAGPLDWIGLFKVGSGNSEFQSFGWQYAGATSGTFTLKAPEQTGQYEFRFLPDDDYVDVARSQTVTVR
jgi:hypothetical protein